MKEKKYIDRLYQEKFKDFEATPREEVWHSIEARLREKRNRRIFITPFWSRMAGIAAILALILLIGDWMLPDDFTPAIVDQEKQEQNFIIIDSPAPETIIAEGASTDDTSTQGTSKTKPTIDDTYTTKSSEETSQKFETTIAISEPEKFQQRNTAEVSSLARMKTNGVLSTENVIISAEIEQPKENPIKETPKKSIFEEIENQKELLVAEVPKKSFEVSTHAAPIYYGNFGKGNFLDPRFNDNNSEGEITYSYGVNIAYALSNKFKVRSGVNKVNMSYNTSGVAHKTLAAVSSASGITIEVKPALVDGFERTRASREEFIPSTKRPIAGSLSPGFLNQKMGFIEVPVELEYNLIKRRIEVNLIGGASTLFLDENSIFVNSEAFSGQGKAQNLNDVSFSTNIGFGVDYNLSDKFKLNFEPMLKYQLNTFNESSADNKPYYLGIYTGFSFKF